MKPGAVLVDVAIDQGGCFETSRPTTHGDPTFEVDGIIHYCVTNMPGAVPITSTYALTNATLPYVLALADHGVAEAARRDPGLRLGVNVAGGKVTHPAVAEGVGMEYTPPEQVIEIGEADPETPDHGARARPPRTRFPTETEPEPGEKPMATATGTELKNFIDGEFVDPATARPRTWSTRRPAR